MATTATQTAPPPPTTHTTPAAAQATPYRFTVAQYEQMIEAGVFHEDERIELIEGEIIQMAAVGVRHATCIVQFNELLQQLVAGKFYVSPQNPMRLPDNSEPQPDLMVIQRKKYAETPGVADVLFVVEVADTWSYPGLVDSDSLRDAVETCPSPFECRR